MDMTIRNAQDCILQLKAMLNRQNSDVRKLWSERRAFVKIINEYRRILGDYVINTFILGRFSAIIFLTLSSLVLVRKVVIAWLLVYANMILCVDYYSTHVDTVTSSIFRRLVNMITRQPLKLENFMKSKMFKTCQKYNLQINTMYFIDFLLFIFGPTQTLMGSLEP